MNSLKSLFKSIFSEEATQNCGCQEQNRIDGADSQGGGTDDAYCHGPSRPVNSCNVHDEDLSSTACLNSSVSTSVHISGTQDSNIVICSDDNRRDTKSHPCDDWVCSMCTLWGYMFCFNKMTRYKRTEILWMWISVLSVFIGLGIAVGAFGVNEFETAPMDMRIIDHKYSTIFCYTLSLQSEARFRAYRFTGDLRPRTRKRPFYKAEYTKYVDSGDYLYYNFYFLAGSSVSLISCSDHLVELYVIKGQGHFDQWKTNKNCSGCYLASAPVKVNGCFLNYNNYSLSTNETDTYFFVFMNRKQSTWVTAKFGISRVFYDLAYTTQMCVNKLGCRIPVEYNTDQRIVYHMTPKTTKSTMRMSSTCEARLSIFLTIFALGPAIFGLLLSLVIYFACSDPEPERILPRRRGVNLIINRPPELLDEECTPLLWETISSDPPQYDDINISASCPERPPSYEEIDKE